MPIAMEQIKMDDWSNRGLVPQRTREKKVKRTRKRRDQNKKKIKKKNKRKVNSIIR